MVEKILMIVALCYFGYRGLKVLNNGIKEGKRRLKEDKDNKVE